MRNSGDKMHGANIIFVVKTIIYCMIFVGYQNSSGGSFDNAFFLKTGCCCRVHRGLEKIVCNNERRFSVRIYRKYDVSFLLLLKQSYIYISFS